jgi:biopolymer transport protein ExbD
MKLSRPITTKARIEMLPLIDIIFLVLVVFIFAMLSMAVHRSLPVELPRSSTVTIDPQVRLTITVRADHKIFVNKEPVSLDELSSLIREKAQMEENPGVALVVDQNVSYRQLFDVLDRIRQSGVAQISLQAEEQLSP